MMAPVLQSLCLAWEPGFIQTFILMSQGKLDDGVGVKNLCLVRKQDLVLVTVSVSLVRTFVNSHIVKKKRKQ